MGLASDIRISVKSAAALAESERIAWMDIRAQNPALYSPYFDLAYTELMGTLRPDTYVVIAYQNDLPISFFPFQGPQALSGGFARPIGAPMTDYHGFIEQADLKINHVAMLKQAGIGALHYSSLVGHQTDMSGFHQDQYPLCLIDLSGGVTSWRESRDSSYRRSLKKNRRRIRRTEEQYGARRLEFCSQNIKAFNQLIDWKKQRFVETGLYDVLSANWTSGLLKQLWSKTDGLRCDLHVLYFGDQLAAMDMGLTDGAVFHSWIVAYNPEFHPLSPGTQLLEDLIDAAPELGYKRIDLGAELDSYKSVYSSSDKFANSGFIPVAGSAAAISRLYGAAEKFGEKSLGDLPGKLRRRYTQITDCDDTLSGRAKAMIDAVKTGGSR